MSDTANRLGSSEYPAGFARNRWLVSIGIDGCNRRNAHYRDVILAAIEAEVDITLVELAALLRSQYGASFAPSTVWRFLDRHDLTFKKNSARQRAGAARRRCPASGLVRRAA